MTDSKTAKFLHDHPRLMGVLFTMMLLLTQAGSAAASNGNTLVG